MAKKTLRIPFLAILLILVVGVFVGRGMLTKKQQAVEEEEMVTSLKEVAAVETESVDLEEKGSVDPVVEEEAEEEISYVSPYDFDALHEANEDIVGWVEILDTLVNYPVCFDGTDDYLHKSVEKTDSYAGTLYVSPVAVDPLNDKVNIIYGHNMKNGSMFAAVDDFVEKPFSEVNIYREDGESHLSPVLCVVGKSDVALESISNVDDLAEFCADKRVVSGEIPEQFEDMTVLVTCNYTGNNYRTYLFCAE